MKEYLLFPKKHYFITQGNGNGTYSHTYGYAIDVSASKSRDYNIYAPFTGYVAKKYVDGKNANCIWLVSNDKVICKDGIARYAVVMMAHPNEIPNFKVGDTFVQGKKLMTDGTSGGVAKHLHLEVAVYDNKKDIKANWYKAPDKTYPLTNGVQPTDYMVMADDGVVVNEIYSYQNRAYHFTRVSEVVVQEENVEKPYLENGATYKLLYSKALRNKPSMVSNIIKAQNVDNYTKTLLVSQTGNAMFKVGTEIKSLNIVKETNGRAWGSYGNCWYCLQNIDGKHNAERID